MIILPTIKFIELQDKTEAGLMAYLMEHRDGDFLVYLRQRYTEDAEWDYSIEGGSLCNYDDLEWFMDWHEGQDFVEYLAITVIDEPNV